MNFQIFGNRIKIFFLITILFLFLTIGMFVASLVTTGTAHTWSLLIFIWFGAATTLLFNYLLWKNLPFLQKLDIARSNNTKFFLSLIVYIIFFPIIAILSLVFLIIFTIAILILLIMNLFRDKKSKHDTPNY